MDWIKEYIWIKKMKTKTYTDHDQLK